VARGEGGGLLGKLRPERSTMQACEPFSEICKTRSGGPLAMLSDPVPREGMVGPIFSCVTSAKS